MRPKKFLILGDFFPWRVSVSYKVVPIKKSVWIVKAKHGSELTRLPRPARTPEILGAQNDHIKVKSAYMANGLEVRWKRANPSLGIPVFRLGCRGSWLFVYIIASLGVLFEINSTSDYWKRKIGTSPKDEFLLSFQQSQVLFISSSTTRDAILD